MKTRFNRHYLELITAFTAKELKARYKRAVFGFLWVIITPLLQMAIIGSIFSYFIKSPVDNYLMFLFGGLLVWNFLSLSISKATPSIVNERHLIQKSNFPRNIIPVSIILANFFHLTVSLFLFILLAFLIPTTSLQKLFLLPPILAWILSLVYGLSLASCALNVKYRDINFIIHVLLQIWFYATPIIYPFSFIPDHIQTLYYFNPLTAPIQLLHFVTSGQPPPRPDLMVINFLITLIIILAGDYLFRKESPRFDDWV